MEDEQLEKQAKEIKSQAEKIRKALGPGDSALEKEQAHHDAILQARQKEGALHLAVDTQQAAKAESTESGPIP